MLSSYSFFDTQSIAFDVHPKNHELLGHLTNKNKVKQMIAISEGWYTITIMDDGLYYNDLRFGLLSLEPGSQAFVFQYKIEVDNSGNVTFIEQEKNKRDAKKLMLDLWQRIKGN